MFKIMSNVNDCKQGKELAWLSPKGTKSAYQHLQI